MSAAEKLPELFTEAQAAEMMGMAEVTLRRYRKQQKIAFIRLGGSGRIRYTEQQLLQFLENMTCPASALANTGSNSAKDPQSGIGHGSMRADASNALRLAQETLRKHG